MKTNTILLLLILSISIISCEGFKFNASVPIITEKAFLNAINSFNNSTMYDYVSYTDSSYIFVIKSNDSIFVYNVEKTKYTNHLYNIKDKYSLVR